MRLATAPCPRSARPRCGPSRSAPCVAPARRSTSCSPAARTRSRCARRSAGRRSTSPCRSPSAAGSGRSYGSEPGVEYLTGYLVEKSLSVDNLFVFMLLLAAFAVPRALQQRVLLYGIVGALVLRGIFIALGAAALQAFDWVVPGLRARAGRDRRQDPARRASRGHDHEVDVDRMRSVRLVRRLVPVTDEYDGPRLHGRGRAAGGRSPRSRLVSSRCWPPTSSSRSTRCRRSTASPATPTWSSPPTPSRCSACGRCTSCSRARSSQLRAPRLRPGRDPRLHRRQAGAALGATCTWPRGAGDPDAGLARRDRRHPRRHRRPPACRRRAARRPRGVSEDGLGSRDRRRRQRSLPKHRDCGASR